MATLADGEQVRVTGIARRGETDLEAPLTGRRVLGYVAALHTVGLLPFDRVTLTEQEVVIPSLAHKPSTACGPISRLSQWASSGALVS